MDELQKEVDLYINDFHDVLYCLMDENGYNRLQTTINRFNSHKVAKYAISGSGFTFEQFFNYAMLENLLKRTYDGH